jgi:hypothetical protein
VLLLLLGLLLDLLVPQGALHIENMIVAMHGLWREQFVVPEVLHVMQLDVLAMQLVVHAMQLDVHAMQLDVHAMQLDVLALQLDVLALQLDDHQLLGLELRD